MNKKIKKLRLYGEKDGLKGFIADIYVKNNKLIVESENKKVKKELFEEINKEIQKGEAFRIPYTEHTGRTIEEGVLLQKIGDSKFLEALEAEFWKVIGLGDMGKFGNKKFGGYEIKAYKSKIIEK
ncbi:MAG: hypothetical protein ACKKMR_01775 [Candidatus Nealsonbacteria bacterium]